VKGTKAQTSKKKGENPEEIPEYLGREKEK
jgi:hypothetical protein